MLIHIYNPSTREAEAGEFEIKSLRPAWAVDIVSKNQGVGRE
jgi:hypothetical protein